MTIPARASSPPGRPTSQEQGRPLPPGPKGHLLTGNLPEMAADWLVSLTGYARAYGDFVPLRFGPLQFVLVSDPAAIEEVLTTKNHLFVKGAGERRLGSLIGHGLLISEGDFWRRQRRLMQPAFHRDRIAAYAGVMAAYAGQMVDSWHDGDVHPIRHEMMAVTLKVVCKALFDMDMAGSVETVGEALDVVIRHFDDRFASLLFLLPDQVPTPENRRYRRAVQRLDEIVDRIIEERRAQGVDRGDLLSMLLQVQDEDGSRMTDRQLRDEVLTLVLAGHETTALALTWALYLLAQHPQVEARLHAELDAALGGPGGRLPGLADLPQLPYTQRVIDETLRLYPPASLIERDALADCVIGGYRIKKGTTLVISQWVVHRDPRFFEQPETFDPDRWANGRAKHLPRYAYFPFGGGQRICIGASFAMMEAVIILATIAQRYRLTLEPGQVVVPHVAITLRPKDDILMAAHRR